MCTNIITVLLCVAPLPGFAEIAAARAEIAATGAGTTEATTGTTEATTEIAAARAEMAEAGVVTDSIRTQVLDEVTVTGNSTMRRISDVQLGAEKLELNLLEKAPVLFGESDIIKSITLLPGVRQESEGSGGYMVRGGTPSQNLVQLDGAMLRNPAHVMGIFSTFNEDALGAATLYKGLMPACYGGATSSVLDMQLAPGNMERWHASGTIGLLAAKINANGPIVKDKLSVAVSARRSYADLFLKLVPKYRSTVMHFYDVNGKIRYIPRSNDIIDVSVSASHDNMGISDIMWMDWGNKVASVRWAARRGDKWRFVTTGALTDYSGDMWMDIMDTNQRLDEYIRTASVNAKTTCSINEHHEIEGGWRTEMYRVKSGEWTVNDTHEKDIRSGWANDFWLSYTGDITPSFSLQGGVRLNLFSALKGHSFTQLEDYYNPGITQGSNGISKNYVNLQPRLSMKYAVADNHSIKGGITASSQNLHAISTSTNTFPFDRYAITSATVKPEKSWQYSLGYAGTSEHGMWEWSAETYYKSIDNVYDYRSGVTMFSYIDIEKLISGGRGRSYGLELMLRKNAGRLTGWISYTLSKTQTKIDGINDNRWYDASNDRRHDLNIVAMYRLTDNWSLSASFLYASGEALSVPDAKYQLSGETIYYYSQRNGYRTPATHRLDISANYRHVGKKFTYEWNFGIYNLYNHYNPYMIYFENCPEKPSGTRAVQYSMYGIVPSVSYTLKF